VVGNLVPQPLLSACEHGTYGKPSLDGRILSWASYLYGSTPQPLGKSISNFLIFILRELFADVTERDLAIQRPVGDTDEIQLECLDIRRRNLHLARAGGGQDEAPA